MTRKEAEDARQAKLVELRKKYLDSKGIISKARPSAKVKLTGLDKVEAEREAKLVELRKKYLAKKRAVTKSVVPTARKMDTATKKKPSSGTGRSKVLGTEKYIAKGNRTGTAKTSSGTGRSKVLGTEKYIAKGNRAGTAKPKLVTGRSKVLGTEKYIAKGKRTAKPKYIAKGKRTGTPNVKTKEGYFIDKKKGNAMVRVFPNAFVNGWANMTNEERLAKGYPTSDSKKWQVDFNQRKELTFIKKN